MLSDRAFRFGVKPLAFLLMLAPFALLVFDYANDALGANPSRPCLIALATGPCDTCCWVWP